jgi:hypothetical protein
LKVKEGMAAAVVVDRKDLVDQAAAAAEGQEVASAGQRHSAEVGYEMCTVGVARETTF